MSTLHVFIKECSRFLGGLKQYRQAELAWRCLAGMQDTSEYCAPRLSMPCQDFPGSAHSPRSLLPWGSTSMRKQCGLLPNSKSHEGGVQLCLGNPLRFIQLKSSFELLESVPFAMRTNITTMQFQNIFTIPKRNSTTSFLHLPQGL